MAAQKYVLSITELDENEDHGEKAKQLLRLRTLGFSIPESFIVTAKAYFDFIKENRLETKIKHLLNTVDLEKAKSVKDTSSHIQKHIMESVIPKEIIESILKEYKKLGGILNHSHVRVYFSDVQRFPSGNIKGDAALIHNIKENWLSIFSPQSPKVNPSLIIQKVINGKSGKIRTSTKQIKTTSLLSQIEIQKLEDLVNKFKKEFYMPYEIEWVIKDKIYILKINPETYNETAQSIFPETHYKIYNNSHHLF